MTNIEDCVHSISSFLASNDQAFLTYWSLKNTCFTCYKRDSATFKLLNCENQIPLMTLTQYFDDKFLRNELTVSNFVFNFPLQSRYNCRVMNVFSKIKSILLQYNISILEQYLSRTGYTFELPYAKPKLIYFTEKHKLIDAYIFSHSIKYCKHTQ